MKVLAVGRKDNFTHDAYVCEEPPAKKRSVRPVELSKATHDCGLWVGIQQKGAPPPPPPPPPPPKPRAGASRAAPNASAPNASLPNASAPAPAPASYTGRKRTAVAAFKPNRNKQ